MRKTTQHHFYTIIITLLTTQYIHSSFINTKLESFDATKKCSRIDPRKITIFKDTGLLFKKKSTIKPNIIVYFKRVESGVDKIFQNNNINLEIFVLETDIEDIPYCAEELTFSKLCRADFGFTKEGQLVDYSFECFGLVFRVNKKNNAFQLYYDLQLYLHISHEAIGWTEQFLFCLEKIFRINYLVSA